MTDPRFDNADVIRQLIQFVGYFVGIGAIAFDSELYVAFAE